MWGAAEGGHCSRLEGTPLRGVTEPPEAYDASPLTGESKHPTPGGGRVRLHKGR